MDDPQHWHLQTHTQTRTFIYFQPNVVSLVFESGWREWVVMPKMEMVVRKTDESGQMYVGKIGIIMIREIKVSMRVFFK